MSCDIKKINYLKGFACSLLVIAVVEGNVYAQTKTPVVTIPVTIKTDSVKPPAAKDSAAAKVLPYNKIITGKAVKHKGLITVDKLDNKWYLEIPDSILGKDILIVNRISGAAGGNKPEYRDKNKSMIGYAGDEINETVVRFQRNGKDMQLREISFADFGLKPGDPMYANVKRSDVQPIILTLPIQAVSPDSGRVVEITPTMNEDNALFAFDPDVKKDVQLSMYDMKNSYIEGISVYPQNLTFKTVKTYKKGGAASGSSALPIPELNLGGGLSGSNETYELSSSWVLLPPKPMKTREFDRRIGYFATHYTDFEKDPQSAEITSVIARWRLEPKPEDRKKYLEGELVEPAKPIVIYIDPTTPEKWVPYLMAGINDWQKAFEKAGFKNAIIAKRAPTAKEDSTWSLEDVRYSALVYMPSTISNAMGPHISDPRTGEILETHINWYHNVMALLHSWYMVQCGATDPRARKAEFDDELMGQLIRFVSSHEVGHALGLRHNFLASNATPVEKLRDKAWVEANGHTSSIMDYARFNFVAQPEDHIGPAGLYPRIGDYDKWAIEWGYKWFGDDSLKEEKQKLNAMVLANGNNPRLQFGGGREEGLNDPRAQAEDLGDDDMKANTYGMKNLQYVAKNMTSWLVKKDGSNYDDLLKGYNGLVGEYAQFLLHSIAYIGGIYADNKNADQSNNRFSPAPIEKQREAVDFIDRFFLHEPSWLMSKDISGRLINPQVDLTNIIANAIMSQLYDSQRLSRLANCEERYGDKAYKPLDYLKTLQEKIWSELDDHRPFTHYRMSLQNYEIANLSSLISPTGELSMSSLATLLQSLTVDLSKTDIRPIARMLLTDLNAKISHYLKSGNAKNLLIRAHLLNAQASIRKALNSKS